MSNEPDSQLNELNQDNIAKYKLAGEISNKSLAVVLAAIKQGETVLNLCAAGNESINTLCSETLIGAKKGIAFPTCVSVNNLLCHVSPLASDPEASVALANGDVVRIELGAHIDGYIALVGTTVVVGATKATAVSGKTANVIAAAKNAFEAAIRTLKPGNTNSQVSSIVEKVAKEFECVPVQGMLSHQLLNNVLDGPNKIIFNPTDEQRKGVETVTFEQGQVYSIDIIVSAGKGVPKSTQVRTNVYKRNPNVTYQLKMKASRALLTKVQKECGTMAFSLNSLGDERNSRLGVVECAKHNLLVPYHVLQEEKEVASAHFVATVLLTANGTVAVTSFPWDKEIVKPELSVKDKDLIDLLKK